MSSRSYREIQNRELKELLKKSLPEIEALDDADRSLAMAGGPGVGPGGGALVRAIDMVAHWLETGECDKKTSANFYVYLQVVIEG